MTKTLALYFFYLIFLILTKYHKGVESTMNVSDIVSLAVSIIVPVATIIVSVSKINGRLEELEKQLGSSKDKTLSAEINDSFKNISGQLGTKDYKGCSLSVQHEELRRMIEKKSKEQSDKFDEQKKIITDINERGKEEEYKRKAHEEVMSQRTLESKEVAESFSYLMRRTAELEFELKKNAEESNAKSEEIKRLNNEIDKLRKQLYNLYNGVTKDKPEKYEPLNLTKSKRKGI